MTMHLKKPLLIDLSLPNAGSLIRRLLSIENIDPCASQKCNDWTSSERRLLNPANLKFRILRRRLLR